MLSILSMFFMAIQIGVPCYAGLWVGKRAASAPSAFFRGWGATVGAGFLLGLSMDAIVTGLHLIFPQEDPQGFGFGIVTVYVTGLSILSGAFVGFFAAQDVRQRTSLVDDHAESNE